jgi:predicted GIY-YIG superfamily endonuclease
MSKRTNNNKIHYVYIIRNTNTQKVEYVGVSIDTDKRWKEHTRRTPSDKTRNGKFYGREDIQLEIVGAHPNLHSALRMERHIKEVERIPLTEVTRAHHMNHSKCVKVYDYYTKEYVGTYYSYREAGRELGIHRANITRYFQGDYKRVGRYTFQICPSIQS